MTDGTPMADEPFVPTAALHRTARGIIAAREARIALLESTLEALDARRLAALAAARVDTDTIEDHRAALAAVRKALGSEP